MAFPEMWGPQETAKKEEIKKAAISEVTKALNEGDFNRAAELTEEVKQYFGEADLQKRESETEKFEPGLKPESAQAQEINDLMKESDWDRAIDKLKSRESDPFYYFAFASEMRKFDPKRFDKEIGVSDEMWKRLVHFVERDRDEPLRFLITASALKSLNPERFAQDVKIDDEYWNIIIKGLETERHDPDPEWFVRSYDHAYSLDKERVQKLLSIDNSYWEEISKYIEEMSLYYNKVVNAGAAQRIKPEGFSDITISQEEWQKIKNILEDSAKFRDAKYFLVANNAKDLKVK